MSAPTIRCVSEAGEACSTGEWALLWLGLLMFLAFGWAFWTAVGIFYRATRAVLRARRGPQPSAASARVIEPTNEANEQAN